MMSDPDMEGRKGMKGYYRRPSRAIEKGGGFFVPGLEGERIRVITAAASVIMFAANRMGQTTASLSQVVSEITGLSVALLLFVQGFAEAFPSGSSDFEGDDIPTTTSYLSILQASPSLQGAALESIVRSLVQTCENVVYVAVINSNSEIMLELGPVGGTSLSKANAKILFASGASSASSSSSLSIEDAGAFSQMLPAGSKCIAMRKDQMDWLWVIASTDVKEAFTSKKPWLDSLVGAPFYQ